MPDPDARMGYNVAKDKAYIGYKCHALAGNVSRAFYGTTITPANTGDGKHFIPLMEDADWRGLLDNALEVYGDSAYYTEYNLEWVSGRGMDCMFHDKDESGLHRKKKRTARQKSRIRSVIETLFGTAKNNFTFERPLVRGIDAVCIDSDLIFTAWNMFMVFAWMVDRWMDRTSVKELLRAR